MTSELWSKQCDCDVNPGKAKKTGAPKTSNAGNPWPWVAKTKKHMLNNGHLINALEFLS